MLYNFANAPGPLNANQLQSQLGQRPASVGPAMQYDALAQLVQQQAQQGQVSQPATAPLMQPGTNALQTFGGAQPRLASDMQPASSGMEGITAAPQGPIEMGPGVVNQPQAQPGTGPTTAQPQAPTGGITAAPQGGFDPAQFPEGTYLEQEGGVASDEPAPIEGESPVAVTPPAPSGQASGPPVQGTALWKPVSESDGNLVMLFPYIAGNVTIRDAQTGDVLDTGRSTGPSNGYMDTVRFSRPGAAYQNVIVEDQFGNRIAIVNGAERIENIQVSGYGFPTLPGFIQPILPGFTPIEAIEKPKRKGRGKRLAKSNFVASKAPTADRPQAESKSVQDFVKQMRGR